MDEPSDIRLRDWLLGKLPADDAARFEERLLREGSFDERLSAIENDLLDDIAHDRLETGDSVAALRLLAATPADRQRLRIARALARVREVPEQRTSLPFPQSHHVRRAARRNRPLFAGGALAAACIAIAAVGLWRHAAIEPSVSSTTPEVIATVTLMADQQRGAQSATIDVPHDASIVRLQAEVGGGPSTMRYALRIEDPGAAQFAASGLIARESGPYRFVEVRVPAGIFVGRERTVHVSASGSDQPAETWIVRSNSQ